MYKTPAFVNMPAPAGPPVEAQFRAMPRKTKTGLFAIDANTVRFGLSESFEKSPLRDQFRHIRALNLLRNHENKVRVPAHLSSCSATGTHS